MITLVHTIQDLLCTSLEVSDKEPGTVLELVDFNVLVEKDTLEIVIGLSHGFQFFQVMKDCHHLTVEPWELLNIITTKVDKLFPQGALVTKRYFLRH